MSRYNDTYNELKEAIDEIARDPLSKLNPESTQLACSNVIDFKIACLFGELVEEICAIREELTEINFEVKLVEEIHAIRKELTEINFEVKQLEKRGRKL